MIAEILHLPYKNHALSTKIYTPNVVNTLPVEDGISQVHTPLFEGASNLRQGEYLTLLEITSRGMVIMTTPIYINMANQDESHYWYTGEMIVNKWEIMVDLYLY